MTRWEFTWPTQSGRTAFDAEILTQSDGYAELLLSSSKDLLVQLANECGGHRWQGPVRGKVQTSTVTVAVLALDTATPLQLRDNDIRISTCRAGGPGGQHRDHTASAVMMKHLPTGIEVRIGDERSQHRNRDIARRLLEARVQALHRSTRDEAQARARRDMVGSGCRADKIRTYRLQDGIVIDHRTGSKMALHRVLRGELPGRPAAWKAGE